MATSVYPVDEVQRLQNEEPIQLHTEEYRKVRMALRDLVWRVDHLRQSVETAGDALILEHVMDLLDTSDARAALGLDGAAQKRAQDKP